MIFHNNAKTLLPPIASIAFLVVFFSACLLTISDAFRVQSSAVRGKLFCGKTPAANVRVLFYDEDDGPDPDDLLDSTYTKSDGSFYVSGDTVEFSSIEPELRIYHDCAMHLPLCKREWIIGVPSKYISSGITPKTVMELGDVNLEVELEKEDRHDCFN